MSYDQLRTAFGISHGTLCHRMQTITDINECYKAEKRMEKLCECIKNETWDVSQIMWAGAVMAKMLGVDTDGSEE